MNWENQARGIVRAELVRRQQTYKSLAKRLQHVGFKETERSVANKMSRGRFSFVFFLQCMHALGAKSVAFKLVVEAPRVKPSDSP
jgi:uncharacterized protein DUF6471